MQVIRFATAVCELTPAALVSRFVDGAVNLMCLRTPCTHPHFAELAGYGPHWRRYIVEHDLIHHLLADALWQPWSWSLHDDEHRPLDDLPQRTRDEEHLVQRTQRLMMLGEPDPYRQLDEKFGRALPWWIDLCRSRLDDELGPIVRPISSALAA